MAEDILQAALVEAEKYHAKCIKTISVKIGDEDFVESDSLQFCLEATAKGTIAEGASIEIELVGANELHQIALELD
jgi:hydrogenase nickel incorporation protein HypA/HybF